MPVQLAERRAAPPKKKVFVRAPRDYSQHLRRAFQFLFFALNVWIGVQFVRFVRHYETGGSSAWAARPAGVEGWLPIASLMNLKVLIETGRLPLVHPAGVVLLVAFLAISWLFRKSFCSWLCPVGTISEYLWRIGRDTFKKNWQIPRVLDILLRALKYALLGLMVASLFMQNFWCRYLCPYGALLGLISMASPLRIRRNESTCIDCAKCAKACPSALPVDNLISIKSAECTGCLECVAVCPSEGALQLALPHWIRSPHDGRLPPWAMAAGIAVLFLGIVGYAKTSGYWNGDVPDYVYRQLVPQANEVTHPAE